MAARLAEPGESLSQELYPRLVERNANASSADVWARKAITKNGLQEWLLADNSKDGDVKSEVSFRVGTKPAVVWDMLTQKPVEFESADGWVKVRHRDGQQGFARIAHLWGV